MTKFKESSVLTNVQQIKQGVDYKLTFLGDAHFDVYEDPPNVEAEFGLYNGYYRCVKKPAPGTECDNVLHMKHELTGQLIYLIHQDTPITSHSGDRCHFIVPLSFDWNDVMSVEDTDEDDCDWIDSLGDDFAICKVEQDIQERMLETRRATQSLPPELSRYITSFMVKPSAEITKKRKRTEEDGDMSNKKGGKRRCATKRRTQRKRKRQQQQRRTQRKQRRRTRRTRIQRR